jgi:hypothetical protein
MIPFITFCAIFISRSSARLSWLVSIVASRYVQVLIIQTCNCCSTILRFRSKYFRNELILTCDLQIHIRHYKQYIQFLVRQCRHLNLHGKCITLYRSQNTLFLSLFHKIHFWGKSWSHSKFIQKSFTVSSCFLKKLTLRCQGIVLLGN